MGQVIILARESGLRLELSDIPVKSLVPEALAVRAFSSQQLMPCCIPLSLICFYHGSHAHPQMNSCKSYQPSMRVGPSNVVMQRLQAK